MNIPFYLETVANRFSFFEEHFYKGMNKVVRKNNTLMSKNIEMNTNIDNCMKLIDRNMGDSPEFFLIKISQGIR